MPDHRLHCLLLNEDDVPAGTGWLSPREAAVCDGFRFPKRRGDWLLGRWTAKQALIRLEQAREGNPADWEILADDTGAPVAHRQGVQQPPQVSLSHSHGRCLCIVSHAPLRLGCDLERVESRIEMFEETYFEQGEIDQLNALPDSRRSSAVTLIWSAKESVLKAIRTGLSADTRRARITGFEEAEGGCWRPFRAIDTLEERSFYGWWKEDAGMVMTMAADASIPVPTPL